MSVPAPLPRPRLRGVLHQWACAAFALAGLVLVLSAPTPRATVVAVVYALALCGLLGCSALYHRVTWRPAARRWMKRLDHSMIFVLIAGTYTPIALLVLEDPLRTIVLGVVWGGALAGVALQLAWVDVPRWLNVLVYVALGWVAIAVFPQLWTAAGAPAVVLLIAGGVLYTLGGLVYARRRPDPRPLSFGYHEVFHAFVIAAAVLHFVVIAAWVVPKG